VNLDAKVGRLAAARGRLEAAVARHASDPRILLLAARFYARHDDFTRAVPLFRRVVELDPSSFDAYIALGAIYVAQRRLAEARGEFLELAKYQPRSVAPPTMIGLLYHVEGRLPEAREWYEKALAIDRRASTASNNLAWMLAEQGQELDLALSLAQTAIAEKPNQPEIVDTLGWVYYKKDLLGMAIQSFQRALDGDPDNPLYHYHMGVALAREGKDAAARSALQRALELNPTFDNADEARLALQALLY
jgi:Flp pilus assembly protein TadD